ncbi:MAG: Zn-ribbon domain-containing OB-fold protein [Candidatus Odinarchaeia archaeon]
MENLRVSRLWREIPQHYRLEGAKCLNCGEIYFPPRTICAKCKSKNLEKTPLPRRGKILTYTVIHIAPPKHRIYVPYVIALIELENGLRILSQITDVEPSEITIGMPVEAVIRRYYAEGENGLIHYGYKFRPIIE